LAQAILAQAASGVPDEFPNSLLAPWILALFALQALSEGYTKGLVVLYLMMLQLPMRCY